MKAPTTATAYASQVGVQSNDRNETNEHPDTRAEAIPSLITILHSGFTFATSVRIRGEVVILTKEIVQQCTDRTGNTFLTLDDDAQVKKYGRQMWRVGDCSAEIAEADEASRVAGIQAEKFQADRDGLVSLKLAWAEEAEAMGRAKSRWHSTNSGRPKA